MTPFSCPGWAEISTTEGSVEKEGGLTLLQSDPELPTTAPRPLLPQEPPEIPEGNSETFASIYSFPCLPLSAGDETQSFKQVFHPAPHTEPSVGKGPCEATGQ